MKLETEAGTSTGVSLSKRERIDIAVWDGASLLLRILACVWVPAATLGSAIMLLEGLHLHRVTATVLGMERADSIRPENDLFKVRIEGEGGAYVTLVTRLTLSDRPSKAQIPGESRVPMYCSRSPGPACFPDSAVPWRFAGGFAMSVPFALAVAFGYGRKSRRAVDTIINAARRRLGK